MEKDHRKGDGLIKSAFGALDSSTSAPNASNTGIRTRKSTTVSVMKGRQRLKRTTGGHGLGTRAIRSAERRKEWMLLAALRELGEIRGRAGIQRTVFLAQYESGISGYEFADNEYEPYSEALARDIASNPNLVSEETRLDDEYSERHYVYSLTGPGRERLSRLENEMDQARIKKAANAIKICRNRPTAQVLELVYSRFKPRFDGKDHRYEVLSGVLGIMDLADMTLRKSHTKGSVHVLACMKVIRDALSRLGNVQNSAQRLIVFNISMSVIQKCGGIMDGIKRHDYYGALNPALWDIEEGIRTLAEYCDAAGIMKNPYSVPVDEIMTEEDAKRLSEALAKAIPF